ncbi:unnamed protein product [Phytophthora lilii]|uniref:Unnamed protein product n=1 Tax=Phytophthora lilii TaxID=2077276 RepID=A0A9W7CFQ9_9STRA|nr:unnamed protein product [Phytophthora lilii]
MATMKVGADNNNDNVVDLETMLLDDKLEKFLEADNARLVDELSSEKFRGQEAFLILPTRDSIEWQFEYYAREAGLDELPSRCGVKRNDNAFVIWCHNVKESTLYLVRARFPDSGDNAAETTKALLDAAVQEARKFKLKKVVIWDPPSGLLHDDVHRQLGIEVAERQLSLSSAMVFRHGKGTEGTLPVWFSNEKYAWV